MIPLQVVVMIKITKNQKKIKKKVTTKDTPKKTLVEGDDFKRLQKKAKKLVLNMLIILNEKIINT